MSFTFTPLKGVARWEGRYARIPGYEPAFHTSISGDIVLKQRTDGEKLTYPIVPCPAAVELAKAVNETKTAQCGLSGGSFVINERGQVICPIQSSSDRFHVGSISGDPHFHDVRNRGKTFTLKPSKSLASGTPWPFPYLGTPFTLRLNGKIAFQQGDADSKEWIYPPSQDTSLIALLRKIRGEGAIRFIVNPHGAVFTKVPAGGEWRPVFVGFINPERWFSD